MVNCQNYRSLGAVDDLIDALLPEAVRLRATVHQVVHSTEGAVVLTCPSRHEIVVLLRVFRVVGFLFFY